MEKEELKEVVKQGVKEGVKAHVCHFDENERSVLKDVAAGGLAFKRAIIYILVVLAIAAMGFKYLPDFSAARNVVGK